MQINDPISFVRILKQRKYGRAAADHRGSRNKNPLYVSQIIVISSPLIVLGILVQLDPT